MTRMIRYQRREERVQVRQLAQEWTEYVKETLFGASVAIVAWGLCVVGHVIVSRW